MGRPWRSTVRGIRAALLAAGVAAAMSAAPPAVAQQGARSIGYVDMERLIDNAPQVLAATERLQREYAARDAQLNADTERLAGMEQRIADGRDDLPEDELAQLEREADALRRSIARTRERLQAELRDSIEAELTRTYPRIYEAIAEYAREAGYDLILSSPVAYASGRVDVTDRVLDRLRRDAQQEQP